LSALLCGKEHHSLVRIGYLVYRDSHRVRVFDIEGIDSKAIRNTLDGRVIGFSNVTAGAITEQNGGVSSVVIEAATSEGENATTELIKLSVRAD
jgi:hypothetical protein